jgi:hypothetical protein
MRKDKDKEWRGRLIGFTVESPEVKKEAREMAQRFKPIRISLSSFCQLALKEFMEKQKKNERSIKNDSI